MPEIPQIPLVVPVKLDALVYNQGVNQRDTLRLWPMNYKALGSYLSPEPLGTGGTAFGGNLGVYLHWTLPTALRHGVDNPATNRTDFPLVPNRWLLVRLNGSSSRQAKAWVIESDCPFTSGVVTLSPAANSVMSSSFLVDSDLLSLWKGSADPVRSAVAPDPTVGVPTTTIGVPFPLESWSERAAKDMFLTAVAPANPVFSAYIAHNMGVFSFYDDLQGVGQDTLSYYLVGWYSDPDQDVMMSWNSDTKSQTPYEDLLSRLKWNVIGGTESQASSSLYQGAAFSIPWDPTGNPPADDPLQAIHDSGKLNVGIGNTTIDAFSSLIAPQLGDAAKSKLLRAFQYDYLPQLNQPNGDALLDQKIRQDWFGSKPGGYAWTIVEKSSDGTTAVTLTAEEQSWLDELNQNQIALDEARTTLTSLQRQVFYLWFKQGYLSVDSNVWPVPPDGIDDLTTFQNQLTTQLDPDQAGIMAQLVAQFQVVQTLLTKVPQPDTSETDNAHDAFLQGIQTFAKNQNLDASKTLKAIAAPRYWLANNPVVVFSGVDPMPSAISNTALDVRLASHLSTGFSVTGQPVNATSAAAAFPTLPNLAALPANVGELVQELFLLDPTSAAALATATSETESTVAAIITAHSPADYQGTLPSMSLANWQQPWEPMFLDWKANYTHVPATGATNDWWVFDGTDYRQRTGAPLPTTASPPLPIAGTSLLSTHAQFVFGSRLDEFAQKYGANSPLGQIDSWIQSTYGWKFLAQELVGFGSVLSLRDPRVFRRPWTEDVVGTAKVPVAALVGYDDGAVPAEFKLPPSYRGAVDGAPLFPNGVTVPFHGIREGQLYLTDLYLYDKFGRVLFLIESGNQSGLYDYRTFPVQIDTNLLPTNKLNPNITSTIQLPPRVLQPSRLDFRLVDAQDDAKVFGVDPSTLPISGWVLPNHLDKSILLYAPDGKSLGEFHLVVDAQGNRSGEWQGPPHSSLTLDDVAKAAPRIHQMVTSAQFAQEANFQAFLDAIDETLWTTDALGNRVDQNLSVLVGRPLALIRTRLQFQLDGDPINDTGWAATFNEPTPDIFGCAFSVRLGDQATHEDGVMGYFNGDNYDVFNSVAQAPSPQQNYVKPIGPLGTASGGNYLQLALTPKTYAYTTLLVDPRAAIHATTGILPVKQLDIPQQFVDAALSKMEISFRMGPLLTTVENSPPQGNDAPPFPLAIAYPLPAEQNGIWSWWEKEAPEAWTGYDLIAAKPDATFPDSPNTLREGVFQFVTNLDKQSS